MAVTLESYAPFDDGDGSNVTEDTWRAFMKRVATSGVIRNVLNECEVFGDSTGMQVKVKTGEVWIEGHWGKETSQQTLSIAAADPSDPRLDVVIANADFTNDLVEFDVVTGTPASSPTVPSITRSTTNWAVTLAIVSVSAGASTIAAGDVLNARTFGGDVAPTATDDFTFFGDRISSTNRISVNTDASMNGGLTYVVRMNSLDEQVVDRIRVFPTRLQSGGTNDFKIYKGWHPSYLSEIANPSVTLTGTANEVEEVTFSSQTIEAGAHVVVAMVQNSASTTPFIATAAVAGGTHLSGTNMLNPDSSTTVTSAFKSLTSLPSTLDILDGSWTLRDRFPWVALA